MMANRLNLTQEQRDQLKKLREQNRAASKDEMVKLSDLRHQLEDQLLSDNPDQSQITSLVGQIGQLQQQLFAQRMQQRQQELAIYTPEQRQQLRQWRQDRPNFGPRQRGRGFRGPGGF
jgi:Spy/CpxP family protein refolding chaperone